MFHRTSNQRLAEKKRDMHRDLTLIRGEMRSDFWTEHFRGKFEEFLNDCREHVRAYEALLQDSCSQDNDALAGRIQIDVDEMKRSWGEIRDKKRLLIFYYKVYVDRRKRLDVRIIRYASTLLQLHEDFQQMDEDHDEPQTTEAAVQDGQGVEGARQEGKIVDAEMEEDNPPHSELERLRQLIQDLQAEPDQVHPGEVLQGRVTDYQDKSVDQLLEEMRQDVEHMRELHSKVERRFSKFLSLLNYFEKLVSEQGSPE